MPIKHFADKTYPKQLLIRIFKGDVSVDEIINSWKTIIDQELITKQTKGVINDLTRCKLIMDLGELQKYADYLKSEPLLKQIKHAGVTEDPENIIFPTMLQYSERQIIIKAFSDMENAEKWIIDNS